MNQALERILRKGKTVISIDKARQELSVYLEGKLAERMPCSTGTETPTDGYDCKTPEGLFRVTSIEDSSDYIWEPEPERRPYGHWLFNITGMDRDISNAIHGTDEPEKLGRRASHGCVRISNEDITRLKEKYVQIGTPVIVYAS